MTFFGSMLSDRRSRRLTLLGCCLLAIVAMTKDMVRPRASQASAVSTHPSSLALAASRTERREPVRVTWPVELHKNPFHRWKAPEAQPEPQAEPTNTADLVTAEARSQLTLSSAVVGAAPFAVINGTVVSTGDTISGFQIVDIQPRGVIVRKGGVNVELGF